MGMSELAVGLIGLDTSHAKVFSRILNDPLFDHFVENRAYIDAGFPGGSPDFKASISRVEEYTRELREKYGVRIVGSPEEAAEGADGVMITSVDGRVHLEQFRRIVGFKKPVFIDKPFAISSAEAQEIVGLAAEHGIPVMSASVRRYAGALTAALGAERCGAAAGTGMFTGSDPNAGKAAIIGAECWGPIEFVPSQPGWYWYGIHIVEALYAIMGTGCEAVRVYADARGEAAVGTWKDGRIGIARGNRHPNVTHGALIHRENGTEYADTSADGLRKYKLLMEAVLDMFETGRPAVDPAETLEIIRFIEAANESRESGRTVYL
jgi:hypothetical protein